MVAMLILAILFSLWETPPSQTPEFLGMYFILSPPTLGAIASRLLLTTELIAIVGLFGAWLFTRSRTVKPRRATLLSAGNRQASAQEAPSEYRYTLHRG